MRKLGVALGAAMLLGSARPAHAAEDIFGLGNGQDGDLVVSSSTIVNEYTALAAASAAGNNQAGSAFVDVESADELSVGELVMLLQVQGGTYTSGDPGPIDAAAQGVGLYELTRITAIDGTTLTVSPSLQNSYSSPGAQLISVREYESVEVTAGNLTAPAWNGSVGGVVALLSRGGVSLAAGTSLTVSALGFRGGAVSNNTCPDGGPCTPGEDELIANDPKCEAVGGRGESFALSYAACGTDNIASGGGGGGYINAGGAGGGNGGQGSRGGNAWSSGAETGGLPGAAVTGSLVEVLTFGGGGGGGQQNNLNAGPGGQGGGILLMRAASLSGEGMVLALGESVTDNGNDGGGGGGAGGSVFISLTGAAECGLVSVNAGDGSSVTPGHGAGGGGGGGRVRLASSDLSACSVTAEAGHGGSGHTFPVDEGPGEIGDITAPGDDPFACEPLACPSDLPICGDDEACRACADGGECGGTTPVCDASGACVQCNASNDDACTGDAPVCNTATQQCVECVSAATCDRATPVCDANSCRACADSGECGGGTPVCDASGACVQCNASNDDACTGDAPVCDASSFSCVECLTDAQCSGTTPVCAGNSCRACADDDECTDGSMPACQPDGSCGQCSASNASECVDLVCNSATGTCVACLDDDNCAGVTPVCDTNVCRACSESSECTGALTACGASGACVECTATDGDACTGDAAVCDASSNTCVECTAADSSACTGDTAVCDASSNTCVECTQDSDCGDASSGSLCESNACVAGCASTRNGCPDGFACSTDDGSVGVCEMLDQADGGVDAGIGDSGVDAGNMADAGTTPDASTNPDAGGQPDAGSSDDGGLPELDAGSDDDALSSGSGCDCDTTGNRGTSSTLAVMLLALLWWRRKTV